MGFYVILETDLETHGFTIRHPESGYDYDMGTGEWPCDREEWKEPFLDRMIRAVERDKNHPSVIMWSTGNESNHGVNHMHMIDWAKRKRSFKTHSLRGCITIRNTRQNRRILRYVSRNKNHS